MKVSLTLAHRVGIKHVLDNLQGISMEGAQHTRSLRQSFDLIDIPERVEIGVLTRDLIEKEYSVESGRIEWFVEVVKTAFANKAVHPVLSDLVLNVYEVLSQALNLAKELRTVVAL